ncbi:hypothetical protein Acr_11g0010520 [Actinidia rufa]|uniref:Retrotransposon gag domain-containing protein n=1 Tax=Actinidia rufa TaxID=165716 RepID=A0A7J0FE80_9ERIC|nr:hypothetical protein Acr_11g0010520 [Actinidia rufa]
METTPCEILSFTTPTITGYSPDGNLSDYVSYISEISFHTHPSEDHAVTHGHGRPLRIRGPVPRKSSNIDCWLLAQFPTTTVWHRLWERQFSMHLRSRNLPRPSASSPLDNRAPPMANASQVPDLEGLHHEIHGMAEQMRVMNENNARLIQLLAAANPQPQQHHLSLMSSDLATLIVRGIAPTMSVPNEQGIGTEHQVRPYVKGVPLRNLVKLDPEQTDPPFTERVLRTRISSKFKLPTQLGIYEGKTDPMDHLDSYKSLMFLQGCSDEVMCKAFSATLKGSARSWFRKLSPGTIDSFGELSRLFVANFMSCRNRQKNASHLFTVHQKETESLKDFDSDLVRCSTPFPKTFLKLYPPSRAKLTSISPQKSWPRPNAGDEERRSIKRKEPDTRRVDYKEETRYKRPDRDPKRSNNRRPRTPPHRPEFNLPPLNAPVAQVLSEIKHEEFIKWPGKIKTDPQKRNRNKYCEFHRDHGHNTKDCFQLKEQIADLIKRGYLRKYITDRPTAQFPRKEIR